METTTDKPVYKVIGKMIYRASVVALEMGRRADGTPNIVQQPGPMERIPVGTLLYDVREDEVAAFGDRLELLSEEDVAAAQAAQKAAAQVRAETEAAEKVQVAEVAAAEAASKAEEAATAAKEAQRVADMTKDAAQKATAQAHQSAPARPTGRVATPAAPVSPRPPASPGPGNAPAPAPQD